MSSEMMQTDKWQELAEKSLKERNIQEYEGYYEGFLDGVDEASYYPVDITGDMVERAFKVLAEHCDTLYADEDLYLIGKDALDAALNGGRE